MRAVTGDAKSPRRIVAVVKRDCPTCVLVEPVLRQLAAAGTPLTVLTQDDPAFPAGIPGVVDDTGLERSFALGIEIVPTLLRIEHGRETTRAVGWHRGEWEAADRHARARPGPARAAARLRVAHRRSEHRRRARHSPGRRHLQIAQRRDRRLRGRARSLLRPRLDGRPARGAADARFACTACCRGRGAIPSEVLGRMPRRLRAVHGGEGRRSTRSWPAAGRSTCRWSSPRWKRRSTSAFSLHGVVATTMFVGPIVIVNGPIRKAIGMNSGVNALGQGNRANSTIGRALQLVIRNVGGGKPGGVDRATFGTPGKVGFCFAENEEDSCWEPLSVERGIAPGKSAVTLFAGYGVRGVVDQTSRTPESLARSFAACLAGMRHPKIVSGSRRASSSSRPSTCACSARRAGRRQRFKSELMALTTVPAEDVLIGRRRNDARRARERAGNDADQVSRGRALCRPCGRNRRTVLGYPRRLESRAPAPESPPRK